MTKDEALKMAIEEMTNAIPHLDIHFDDYFEAINACKEALEQPAQEPVAFIYSDPNGNGYASLNPLHEYKFSPTCVDHKAIPLYTHPALQPAQEPVALLEALSDLEHQQWMKWAKSIIDSEPISEARKQRWLTMMVDYKDLPDNIQEYDREWARKVMALYTHPAPQPAQDGIELEWYNKGWNDALKEKNYG